jgi:hypothetical protein
VSDHTKHALRAALSAFVALCTTLPLILSTRDGVAQTTWAASAVAIAGVVNRLLAAVNPFLPTWLRVGDTNVTPS